MRARLVLLAVLGLTACSGGDDGGSPGLSIRFATAGPDHTNGRPVTLALEVTGDPDRVDVAVDGVVLGEVVAPYTFTWRTDALPEGAYALVARARRGDAEATSAFAAPADLAADAGGAPLLATTEVGLESYVDAVVRRWTGGSWEEVHRAPSVSWTAPAFGPGTDDGLWLAYPAPVGWSLERWPAEGEPSAAALPDWSSRVTAIDWLAAAADATAWTGAQGDGTRLLFVTQPNR